MVVTTATRSHIAAGFQHDERREMSTEKTESFKVESIVRWCNDHYDEGGHWVIETMGRDTIAEMFDSLEDAIDFCHVKEGRCNECQ